MIPSLLIILFQLTSAASVDMRSDLDKMAVQHVANSEEVQSGDEHVEENNGKRTAPSSPEGEAPPEVRQPLVLQLFSLNHCANSISLVLYRKRSRYENNSRWQLHAKARTQQERRWQGAKKKLGSRMRSNPTANKMTMVMLKLNWFDV